MSYYYEENNKWRRIVAGALVAAAVLVITFKYLQCGDVWVKWDSERVERGDVATLWVRVKNCTDKTMEMVVVKVDPVSPYLRVYSEQNMWSNEFYIPKLASGAEATARFGVVVDSNAYAGDHAVRVIVAMPGETRVYESKIRVV
ncbi:MAG TPA: hypothetical protein EYH14_00235 [Euryarchaeota archaeon]|nr:hypothetical protein [Euryarchaeota archaeon]